MRKYSSEHRALLWLNMFVGLITPKINKLVANIGSAEKVLNEYAKHKAYIDQVCGKIASAKMGYAIDNNMIDSVLEDMGKSRIGFITRDDIEYPYLLKEIPCPPSILYYKGDIALLGTRIVGVVGSREPSRYGAEVTQTFSNALAKSGLTIGSGLARGIDSIAHSAAIAADGKTIAVLGCGIDKVYPAENAHLYRLIEEKGLIISEYPLGAKPSTYHFPERNRIISGISCGVLVTEAGLKSGSIITAEITVDQGRELYVIPSNITSKRAAGSNNLIKRYPHSITLSPDDILERMGLQQPKMDVSTMQLDFTTEKILEALSYGDLHFDELREISGLGVSALNAVLAKMELLGLAKKLENNYYGA